MWNAEHNIAAPESRTRGVSDFRSGGPPIGSDAPGAFDKQSIVDIFITDIGDCFDRYEKGARFAMKIARSILGVFIGYAIFALSAVVLFHATGRDPHSQQDATFTAIAIVYGMVFAAVGGLLSALIAGRRPMLHAAIVCAILALGAIASLLSRPGAGALWSQIAAIVLMAPSALVGGAAITLLIRRKPSSIG
jgi:hypothetical protein